MTGEERIKALEAELARIDSLPAPSELELIEFAKKIHPYYYEMEERGKILSKLNQLKNQ
jgi:hypothetical protein